MDSRSQEAMAAVSINQNGSDGQIGELEPKTAPLTSTATTDLDGVCTPLLHSLPEPAKQESDEEQPYTPVMDDQLRTPTSEYPSTVPTPATSWTSQELPPQLHDLQTGDLGNVQHVISQDCYFTTRAAPSSNDADIYTALSRTTLSSPSRTKSVGDSLDGASGPEWPGAQWKDHSSQYTHNDTETPRPTSVPVKPSDGRSRNRPNYPNQSFAALQAQHIPPHYPRPRPLRTRSSHQSQHQSFSADDSKRSRDFSSVPAAAKTAGNTPAQSPGLFPPPFSPNRPTEENEDGQYNTPLLHPSHMQAPKETHKLLKDIDPISGRKLVNNYELQKKLGSGQHGTVKLGRNLETNEKVAVKIVRRFSKKVRLGKTGDPSDMIKKEVAILKKARHPHVVSLLEVIDDDEFGKVYLVLEFVERGEIVWRKQTDRDVAIFEMKRAKREMVDQFDEAYEVAEIERFNSTASARRLEKAHLLAEQKLQAENLLKSQASALKKSVASSESCWSLEYAGIENEEASEAGSLPEIRSRESLHSSASDSHSRADTIEGSPQSSVSLEPSTPRRLLDSSNTIEHPIVADLKRESRPASPTTLEGSMYGPYTSDERSSNVALRSTLDQIMAQQNMWTEEEEEFMYVPCLTISQALDAFRDTVLGLEYLHYQGIIHRDIKPANLLWTKDRRVKISDFGVSYLGKPIREDDNKEEIPEADAADLDEALELAKTVGTPAFYAPELCDPQLFDFGRNPGRPQITGQIDVWALGVTLYGMIFGRLPFFDVNEFAMYERIARQEVFIPRMRLKGVEVPDPDSGDGAANPPMNSNKRDDHRVEYEEVDDDLRDLLKRLLHKHPLKRISLKEVKHHPWVLRGIKDPSAWIDETDPSVQSQGRKIEVSTQDVQDAVIGLTIVDRIKSGIRRLGSVVRGRERDSRKRSNSSTKALDQPILVHTPQPSLFHRDWRRQSLRGDEQITSALRASREGPEHPLSRSVAASPEPKPGTDYFDGSIPTLPDATSPRPTLGERLLSTAESTKTIRATVPPTVRQDLALSDESFSPTTHVVDTGSSSSLGGIFSGAGRSFVNSMRSRERGPESHSPSQSSRSSSMDPTSNAIDDPHASPSIAYSSAVAAGHVDQPPVLHEDVLLDHSVPVERTNSPILYRFPSESSAEAFQQAQDMNHRRETLAHNHTTSIHRRTVSSAAAIACPPSPDDNIFDVRRNSVPPNDEAPPFSISSSSDHLPSGLSESTSHPSIPSVISGASSLSATIEPEDYLAPIKEYSPPTMLPSRAFSGRQRAKSSDQSIYHTMTEIKQPLIDDDEAGWNGDGEQESDSEDEGLEMGGQRKAKLK